MADQTKQNRRVRGTGAAPKPVPGKDLWVARLDLGIIDGKRVRKPFYR